jgi:exonuclease SbcC
MRPLKLDIEGFTAFKEPVCLDLSQLDLFAITGPTGAGKSSLIDAIAYALYGRVPRVSTEVASCISQGLDRMLVGLEFMAGEEKYRIFRETRRKGSPNVRLDRWREDGWQPLLDRAREVNDYVTNVVGLDYDGFTRSVLLPQGQFQEFLAGSAEKRRAVLSSLLRLEVYESMRKRASGISSELRARIEEREHTLAGLAEATPENVRWLEAELTSAGLQLEVAQAELKSLEQGVALAGGLKQAQDALGRCETEAIQALAEFQKTSRLIDEGDEALTEVEARLQALQAQLEANCYDAERHNALSVALERVTAVAQVQAGIEQATTLHNNAAKQLAGANAAVEKSTKAHEQGEAELVKAEAARTEAQRHNLVAAVQHGLKPGDACPVCNGKIGQLVAVEAGDLDAADKRYQAVREAEAEGRASLAAATNAASKAGAAVEGYERQLEDLQSRLAVAQAAVDEVLPPGQDASAPAVQAALQAQAEARKTRLELDTQLKQATEQRQAMSTQLDQARHHMSALEQRSQAAAEALEAAQEGATAARDALEAASGEWPEVAEALRKDANVAVVLRHRLDETQARQAALVKSMGQLETRIEYLKADIEKAEALRAGVAELKQEHNVAADLAQMLGAGKFQTFVQQEALLTLAAHGSTRLEQLSGGRYKLQLDEKGAEFDVVDQWNADMARSVRTLSGGETFLASLALSLALAESLPGLAASRRVVLDSIFLDEGFGSLDAEALDRAADALDALALDNRMVCIVTHLPELAQRLPARVVVTKTEAGSSVAVA